MIYDRICIDIYWNYTYLERILLSFTNIRFIVLVEVIID